MSRVHGVSHESHAAAWEATTKSGKVRPKGKISTPAIYSTVPPPRREKPSRHMERLNLEHGVWVKAEASLQKHDLATMVRIARATPAFLRVVVIDHMGRAVVLSPSAVVKGDVKPGQMLRVNARGNVQRVTPQKAHVVPNAPVRKKQPPKPRRAPEPPKSKRAPVREIVVPHQPTPIIEPVRDTVLRELAYASRAGARLGALGDALARAAVRA